MSTKRQPDDFLGLPYRPRFPSPGNRVRAHLLRLRAEAIAAEGELVPSDIATRAEVL